MNSIIKQKRLVLVKFGGSLITDKFKEKKVNFDEIENLSSQIKEVLDFDKNLNFIIGNGAGSFGHIQVEKYQLKDKIKTFKQRIGFAQISNLVMNLNFLVVSSFIKYGIPAVSVKPSSIAISSNGELNKIYIKPIIQFINKKFIPVVYGDMILDSIKGGVVLSTDKLFYVLINNLIKKNIKIEKVIFCSLTNGVLDSKGKTIPMINRSNFSEFKSVFFENKYIDVTGGMKKKVETAIKIASLGIKSYIIHGRDLKKCLLNNKFLGTVIS